MENTTDEQTWLDKHRASIAKERFNWINRFGSVIGRVNRLPRGTPEPIDENWTQKFRGRAKRVRTGHNGKHGKDKARKRQNRIAALRQMPYQEYLKTNEWQATRKRLLKLVEYRCQFCNQPGKLNVHHRTYERIGDERDTDLIVLCRDCHARFHDKLERT